MGIKLQAGSKFSAGMKLSTANAGWSMIVGADFSDGASGESNGGAVYLVKENGEQVDLVPSDQNIGSYGMLGKAVATNGDVIVIGHGHNDLQENNAGAVFVFDSSGQELYAHYDVTPVSGEGFGDAIALSQDGTRMAVRKSLPNYAGVVVLMDIDGSNKVEITYGTDFFGGLGYRFGFTANKFVIADTEHPAARAGEVYIYNLDGSLSSVVSSPASGDARFGENLAVDHSGSKFVVSAPYANGEAGAMYVYEEDGTLLHTITTSGSNRLGQHVAYGSGKIVTLDKKTNFSLKLRIFDEDGSNEIVKTSTTEQYHFEITHWTGALSIFGNVIAAGASGYTQRGPHSNANYTMANNPNPGPDVNGIVFLYDLDGTNERRIVPTDPNITNPNSFYMPQFGVGIAGYQQAAPVMPYVAPVYDWTSATQPLNLSNGGGDSTGAVASNSTGFAQGHMSSPSEVVVYDTSGNVVHTISGPVGASSFGGYRMLLMNETHILIASYNYATDGLNVGKAWLHDVTTGTLLHSFLPAGYAQNTGVDLAFGSCIGLSEKYAAIGINAYADQPKIHQYDVSTGLLVREITPHAPVGTNQRWGHGVAISDSYVAAGVPSGSNHGYVEIFDASNGQFLRTLNNPQPSSLDYFGTTVRISGDYICISTPNEDSPTFGYDTGVVYVFNITDGSLLQTITPTIATGSFGMDISVSGKYLAISDYAHVPGRTTDYPGRAFVYDMTDGSLLYTANNPTPVDYDFMGQSVSISGGSLITVARNDGQNQAHVWKAPLGSTQLPYVAPPSAPSAPSAPTPNKILMYSPDNLYNSAINNIRGGLVMSDFDGSNSITLQTLTPQSSAGGDGKVVSITRSNSQIRIYDQTTGQLEQTFNDATVDSAMAAQINESAMSIAIGAGKIFINAAEYYPNGLGAIIVVDLLDRNVPTYLITPVVSGTYSRIGTSGYGGLRFIEGRIYAGSAPWDATARGIHGFDVDGSNPTFIPTSYGTHSFVKYGDNWAASNGDDGVEILSSTGQVLHSVKVSPQFGYHLETTLSGKLVVVDHTQFNSKVYIYDEGLTNEVVISGDQQANDDLWGDGSVTNRAGVAVFGNDILVSAKNADANGLTNCGAVYRYNDSGVLQDIFYGTVNQQMLGQRIEVAY